MSYRDSRDDCCDEPGRWKRLPLPVRVLLIGLGLACALVVLKRVNDQRVRQVEAEQFLQGMQRQFGDVQQFVFEDLPRTRETAESFIKDLRAGRFDAAYAAT